MKLLGVSLLAAGIVAASAAAAPQKGYFTFRTPTRNIVCAIVIAGKYSESGLRCDIFSGLKPKVKRPKGCEFDFGGTLGLRPTGRALIGCVSDAISPVQRVLRYGQTYRKGPFTCKSARTGLTCLNADKRGFFLSKQVWRRI